jgi:hypothetical protein
LRWDGSAVGRCARWYGRGVEQAGECVDQLRLRTAEAQAAVDHDAPVQDAASAARN